MTYYIASRLIGLFVAGCIISYYVRKGTWKQLDDRYRMLLLILPIISFVPGIQEIILTILIVLVIYLGFTLVLGGLILWIDNKLSKLSDNKSP